MQDIFLEYTIFIITDVLVKLQGRLSVQNYVNSSSKYCAVFCYTTCVTLVNIKYSLCRRGGGGGMFARWLLRIKNVLCWMPKQDQSTESSYFVQLIIRFFYCGFGGGLVSAFRPLQNGESKASHPVCCMGVWIFYEHSIKSLYSVVLKRISQLCESKGSNVS